MPRSDATVFFSTNAPVFAPLVGASISANSSAPSASGGSNQVEALIPGAEINATAGTVSTFGNILWTGTVESGSFEEWHFNEDETNVSFFLTHDYGVPPDYSNANHTQQKVGDGSLLDISSFSGQSPYPTGPQPITPNNDKLMQFTLHNEANAILTGQRHPLWPGNGKEEWLDHYDPASGNPPTDTRPCRTNKAITKFTTDTSLSTLILPQGEERWVSYSVLMATDFPLINLDVGFMTVFGMKGTQCPSCGPNSAPIRGWIGVRVGQNGWSLRDTWMSDDMFNNGVDPDRTNENYRYAYSFSGAGATPSALDSYFPDFAASTAALGNMNLGGWNDWIWHFRTDASEPASANNGFCDIYLRQQNPITKANGAWLKVLEIRPKAFTFDGKFIEKGVGLSGAGYTSYSQAIYCDFRRIWLAPNNARLWVDNNKAGDANVSFEQMTPDGSSFL